MATFVTIALVLIVIVSLYSLFEPKFDLVVSKNKYILLLWYNKYDWYEDTVQRKYFKIF